MTTSKRWIANNMDNDGFRTVYLIDNLHSSRFVVAFQCYGLHIIIDSAIDQEADCSSHLKELF